jgi:hypothetical protein
MHLPHLKLAISEDKHESSRGSPHRSLIKSPALPWKFSFFKIRIQGMVRRPTPRLCSRSILADRTQALRKTVTDLTDSWRSNVVVDCNSANRATSMRRSSSPLSGLCLKQPSSSSAVRARLMGIRWGTRARPIKSVRRYMLRTLKLNQEKK